MDEVQASALQPCPDRTPPDPQLEQLPAGDDVVLALEKGGYDGVHTRRFQLARDGFADARPMFGTYLVLNFGLAGHGPHGVPPAVARGRPCDNRATVGCAVMRIRAAVLEEFAKPLVVQDVELDPPGPGEVLVRLAACGVCHTDLYTASGADPSGYAPTVLGHEGAGVVEDVGEAVTSLSPGDHVVTLFSPQCRECVHCRSVKTNICLAIREQQNTGYLPDGTTRLSRDGDRIRHFMGTSTFAEATVMPEIALAKVDPEAALDVVCTLACGATTGIGAALYIARVEPGSTCAVFGAGLVGLGAVAGCRLAGAERIIAV